MVGPSRGQLVSAMAKKRAGFGAPGGGVLSGRVAAALVKVPKASTLQRGAPSAAAAGVGTLAAAGDAAGAVAKASARAMPACSATAVAGPADDHTFPGSRRGSFALAWNLP